MIDTVRFSTHLEMNELGHRVLERARELSTDREVRVNLVHDTNGFRIEAETPEFRHAFMPRLVVRGPTESGDTGMACVQYSAVLTTMLYIYFGTLILMAIVFLLGAGTGLVLDGPQSDVNGALFGLAAAILLLLFGGILMAAGRHLHHQPVALLRRLLGEIEEIASRGDG